MIALLGKATAIGVLVGAATGLCAQISKKFVSHSQAEHRDRIS